MFRGIMPGTLYIYIYPKELKMTKSTKERAIADEVIINKIYLVREQKVMIDRDLAILYGVETRVLKQAVRRNVSRFPEDFMFEMSKIEFANWRSQNVTSNADKQGLRYAPFCFTEPGVTMLSCVLNSESAITVNIRIIRVFTKLREMLLTHKDILLKLAKVENELIQQGTRTAKNEENIAMIFAALKKLLTPPNPPREPIGFKVRK
ncbi:MAG: hypothetical protein JWP81_2627 [Ferruginibacter sp.]|nr:hypothetical protein [Ferruginibacter sp.]